VTAVLLALALAPLFPLARCLRSLLPAPLKGLDGSRPHLEEGAPRAWRASKSGFPGRPRLLQFGEHSDPQVVRVPSLFFARGSAAHSIYRHRDGVAPGVFEDPDGKVRSGWIAVLRRDHWGDRVVLVPVPPTFALDRCAS
jgi:hypothetical protein